jgi:hypothetical protein
MIKKYQDLRCLNVGKEARMDHCFQPPDVAAVSGRFGSTVQHPVGARWQTLNCGMMVVVVVDAADGIAGLNASWQSRLIFHP